MLNSKSKRVGLSDIARALKSARVARGWSQRELSARSGLPQAQISRIENSDVDPQISTLLELARSLELDIQLVPRAALTAVQATVKDAVRRLEDRSIVRSLDALARFAAAKPAGLKGDELPLTVAALRTISPQLGTDVARSVLTRSADQLARSLEAGVPEDIERDREAVTRSLRSLYDTHAQAAAASRPAYSLDDED